MFRTLVVLITNCIAVQTRPVNTGGSNNMFLRVVVSFDFDCPTISECEGLCAHTHGVIVSHPVSTRTGTIHFLSIQGTPDLSPPKLVVSPKHARLPVWRVRGQSCGRFILSGFSPISFGILPFQVFKQSSVGRSPECTAEAPGAFSRSGDGSRRTEL